MHLSQSTLAALAALIAACAAAPVPQPGGFNFPNFPNQIQNYNPLYGNIPFIPSPGGGGDNYAAALYYLLSLSQQNSYQPYFNSPSDADYTYQKNVQSNDINKNAKRSAMPEPEPEAEAAVDTEGTNVNGGPQAKGQDTKGKNTKLGFNPFIPDSGYVPGTGSYFPLTSYDDQVLNYLIASGADIVNNGYVRQLLFKKAKAIDPSLDESQFYNALVNLDYSYRPYILSNLPAFVRAARVGQQNGGDINGAFRYFATYGAISPFSLGGGINTNPTNPFSFGGNSPLFSPSLVSAGNPIGPVGGFP